MNLGPIKIGLLKRKRFKNIRCIITSCRHFLKLYPGSQGSNSLRQLKPPRVIIKKSGFFGTKYIILVRLGGRDKPNTLRQGLHNCFCRLQVEKIESAAFLASGFKEPAGCKTFAKIAAQELFNYQKASRKASLKKVLFTAGTKQDYRLLNKNILGYLEHIKCNPGPFLTVDGIVKYKKGIVLIRRTNVPFGWALPGGFVDYRESLETAAAREVKEETGLDFEAIKQFAAYSDLNRDPRFHTVSVVFTGRGRGVLKASSDARDAKVFYPQNGKSLPAGLPPDIAFDHRRILKDFINSGKNRH